jgi:tetratricopeptide (TPR) repeat protein
MNHLRTGHSRAPAWIRSSARRFVKTALTVVILTLTPALAAAAQRGPEELWKDDWDAAIKAERQGRWEEGERYLRAALAQAERLGPQDPRLASTLSQLALHLGRQERYDESIELYKRALAATAQTTPGEKARILDNLAFVYRQNHQDADAEKCLRQALQTVRSSQPADFAMLKMALNNLGAFCQQQKRYSEAEAMFQELLEVARNDPKANPPRPAEAANQLASVYEAEGKFGDAERTLLDAITAEEQQGEANLEVARALVRLANHLKEQKGQRAYEEAALNYERALQVSEKAPKRLRLFAAECLYGLADLYDQWGMLDKAESFYLRELDIEMEFLGKQYQGFPMGLGGLGNLYRKQGRLEEILPLARKALTLLEQRLGPEDQTLADSLSIVAHYTEEIGNHTESEALLRRALSIREKAFGPNNPRVAATLQRLADVLRASSQEAEAARILERVQRIQASH